jgi:hypothetical protein
MERAININVRWSSACSSWKSIDGRLYIVLAYVCLYIATQPATTPLENSTKMGQRSRTLELRRVVGSSHN